MARRYVQFIMVFFAAQWVLSGCDESNIVGNKNVPVSTQANGKATALPQTGNYVVFAWNDLGMHCLNPTYDKAVILPPYNNLFVQVIKKGAEPTIVTSGVTVQYRIIGNTYSYGKRQYGQFWDYAQQLFGVSLPRDLGLNLVDPGVHNGLSGVMLAKGDHFEADGIPVTPVNDAGQWNPYQVAEITVSAGGAVVAKTQATVPTSDEINCAKCHKSANPFDDIIKKHNEEHKSVVLKAPVLCASCHASPALGSKTSKNGANYLSLAIHKSHASRKAACYDCHPGNKTQCSRSIAHTASDGNCITCHGDMNKVASSIQSGGRVPWVNEPKCVDCHGKGSIAEVDTHTELYRNAKGHGGMYCASCHGSPHAMVPSNQAADNYQAIQYQGKSKTIGSCAVCHSRSRGGGSASEFAEEHGGANPEKKTACNVCHTSVSGDSQKWPHSFQWTNRSSSGSGIVRN